MLRPRLRCGGGRARGRMAFKRAVKARMRPMRRVRAVAAMIGRSMVANLKLFKERV